jgi:hypothetical protein
VAKIGRYLNDAALRPHRREMWLNTTEKDPEQFQQQVEQVCATYQGAAARHARDARYRFAPAHATAANRRRGPAGWRQRQSQP